jgi:hypothetical protein
VTFNASSSAEFEIRIQEIISAIRRGVHFEDDLVELKRELLGADAAARRLAGHANQANGDVIVWIIGIDEQTGEVHPIGEDVESWWPQVAAEFDDGVFPILRTHRLVRLTEDEFVLALAFETEDAPYVLKTHAPGRDREVPIRTATAVRSARRHELLRLIGPAVRTPASRVIWAEADLWDQGERPEHKILRLTVRVLFSPRLTGEPVFLRAQGMVVRVIAQAEGVSVWSDIDERPNLNDPHEPGSDFAASNRLERIEDGVYVTGVCSADVEAGFHVPNSVGMEGVSDIGVEVEIPVLEARPIKLNVELGGPELGFRPPVEFHWGYPDPELDTDSE